MFYKLHYFQKSKEGICADDFKNEEKTYTINLKMVLSLSDLIEFETPFTRRYVGDYALLTMANDDKYYINERSFQNLTEVLGKLSRN